MSKSKGDANRPYCYRGHALNDENRRIGPDGRLVCLTCQRENQALYRERKRNAFGVRIEFTDEQIQEIIRLYIGPPRTSAARVGAEFGVSSIVIDRVLREQGLEKKRSGWVIVYPVVDGKKQCRSCKEWKSLETHYSRNNNGWRSECNQCRSKVYLSSNREKAYGVTAEQYQAMLAHQGGVCAICKRPESITLSRGRTRTGLSVDHDHETGQVRDLLCSWCNRALGFVNDDVDRVKAIMDYLMKWKKI